MMRPRQVYISRETWDMLNSLRPSTSPITVDQMADDILRSHLEKMPLVQELVQLRKETEQQFEQKAAEIIQARHDTRPSQPA